MNRKSKAKHTDTILTEWEESLPTMLRDNFNGMSERRAFLGSMLKSGAVVVSIPLWSGLSACDRQTAQQALVKSEPWKTFAAVQQRLFPDDANGPSASDISASLYLKFVLDAPDTEPDDRRFITDGIKWLNQLSDKELSKPFVSLNNTEQDNVLKKIASSTAGERWLSQLILYIMEALLSDPVYGGNNNRIGWQWLEHQAGFPTPPKDKRYTELL